MRNTKNRSFSALITKGTYKRATFETRAGEFLQPCRTIQCIEPQSLLVEMHGTVLAFLILMQSGSTKSCPFEGTWIIDSAATQPPDKPTVFLLTNGIFGETGHQIKADGTDQKAPETGYSDTMSVRIIDDHTVEIVSKKAGRMMFTETDTVSADDNTLTQIVKDTTEAETVTIETVNKRLKKGPDGSHALSGSWQGPRTKIRKTTRQRDPRC